MIGWSFNLDLQTVYVSYNNHLKTVYCMFLFQRDGSYHLSDWQTAAARASRYVAVCPLMKPFTKSLHQMCADFKGNTSITRTVTHSAWNDIQMWKAFLCLMSPFESLFSRKLVSFRGLSKRLHQRTYCNITGCSSCCCLPIRQVVRSVLPKQKHAVNCLQMSVV